MLYRRAYSNWLSVSLNRFFFRPDRYIVRTRDGQEHGLSFEELRVYTNLRVADPSFKLSYLVNEQFPFKGREVAMHSIPSGDILGVFLKEEYSFLDVKDKFVIDIGANIGDSAIYFAISGAKKVIAIEPYPNLFSIAMRNVAENGLQGSIVLLNASYGGGSAVKIDASVMANAGSELKETEEGMVLSVYSLQALLDMYGIEEAVLKMDCEGCEYGILNESMETLTRFSKIQLEYHHGYNELISHLKDHFDVRHTVPVYHPSPVKGSPGRNVGFIYATRKSRAT